MATILGLEEKQLRVLQPERTYTGSPIEPLKHGLPKTTQSLCPECSRFVEALLYDDNGRVVMEKTCPEHGFFKDTVYSDTRLYLKMEEWTFGDGRGLENPAISDATVCPRDCGLCNLHTSHTGLANVDLTNRCNLTCPVCFANANVQGYLYEPSFEQVRGMLQSLRDERPTAGRIVQFSGGEPTMHPQFIEICRLANDMGFSHVQAATNGILFTDLDFAMRAKEAGLHTLYLQFDGTCDEVYQRTRGQSLWEQKLQAIENVRKAGMKICFVPTIVKGVNDHQVGDIIRVAIENIEVVSAISFQPVAFTGRIARRQLEKKRFTLPDLARAVEDQTGLCDAYDDWFPLACTTPFSKLISALRGEGTTHLSCHPHCSIGTYLFVDRETRAAVPVTRFVDIKAMLQEMDDLARKAHSARVKLWSKVKTWNVMKKHFRPEYAPPGLTFTKFLQTLQGMTDKRYGREGMDGKFSYHTLMVAGMHFMDSYNYDVERVKRCVIHYSAPNGHIYPFCAYNAGLYYREKIERQFSVPFDLKKGLPIVDSAGGNGNGASPKGSSLPFETTKPPCGGC